MLTINTKRRRCTVPESRTLYSDQERRLNTRHVRNLKRILGIRLCTKQECLRLGRHPIPGIPASPDGSIPAERPLLLYKDVCKRDMTAGNIDAAGCELEAVAEDRSDWSGTYREGMCSEERREERGQTTEGRFPALRSRRDFHLQEIQTESWCTDNKSHGRS